MGHAKVWLNKGRFRFGKHSGELVEDVIEEDPEYIEWILNETGICEKDYETIEALLSR